MRRIVLLLALSLSAFGADRYWAGATAGCDLTWADTDCWATTSGGSGPASVPGAADDVFFDGVGNGASNSTIGTGYNTTINSLNMTGYSGTLTHNGSATVTIDSTGGLIFSATMTYTRAGLNSSALAFTSSSGTTLITTAGKILGGVTFNGAGSFSLQDSFILSSGGILTITRGTVITNNNAVTAQSLLFNGSLTKTLTLGSSAITVTGGGTDIQCNATGTTISANTATLTMATSGHISSLGACNWNGASFVYTAAGATIESSGATVGNITRTGTAAKTNTFAFSGNVTVMGTFTVNGNSVINRMLVFSNTIGTARTITAATVSVSNADFRDITGAGAGDWDIGGATGYSGDCGGNTNITFSTPEIQTSTGATSFVWSTHAWTTRVPLCQDPVVISNAFNSGVTITVDMPRLGQDIDLSGLSWSGTPPTFQLSTSTNTIYGSLTLRSGITWSQNLTLEFRGRGLHTLTSAGVTLSSASGGIDVGIVGGRLRLQDALTIATGGLTLNNGEFDSNGYTVTLTTSAFTNTSTATRTLTMGSSLWVLGASSGTVWNTTTTGLTFTANTATIEFTNTGIVAKTFAGGGATAYGTIKATGNNIVLTGNNTFNTIHLNCPACIIGFRLPAGGTTTFTNFISAGSAGNLVAINSSTASSNTTLSKASGCVGQDYVDYVDITGTGGATWNVGANSTLTRTSGLTAAACSSGRRRPLWVIQ